MASGLLRTEDTCQGNDCNEMSDTRYSVTETQNLCRRCAATKTSGIKTQKKPNHRWYCDKHDKRISFYCESHNRAACLSCALVRHKPCQLADLEDALSEKVEQICALRECVVQKTSAWTGFSDDIVKCELEADLHLKTVLIEADSLLDEEVRKINEEEQNEVERITRKADDEIRNVVEKRDADLKRVHQDAENRREPIETKRSRLHGSLENITEKIQTKVDKLQEDCQELVQSFADTSRRIDSLLEDEKKLLTETQEVATSVYGRLNREVDDSAVGRISKCVRDVRLVLGTRNDYRLSRIDWYGGHWRLDDTIDVPGDLTVPRFVGCINDDDVVISDRHLKTSDVYLTCLNSGKTQRVIESDNASYVMTCSPMKDGTIVCGKALNGSSGETLRGCISLYDDHWAFIRDVSIPRNTRTLFTHVDVHVDKDGVILAAEGSQPTIYVIDPATLAIVNTIKCAGNIRMRGVLSSGDIVAQRSPIDNKLMIINRQGDQREIVHSGTIWNCAIEHLTDDLYILSSDAERRMGVINQVSCQGVRREREVVFPLPKRLRSKEERQTYLQNYRLIMTSSGKLVVSSDEKIFVFSKEFSL